MGDHDIHAFALPPLRPDTFTASTTRTAAPPTRRRIWPWVLAAVLLLSTVAVVAALMAAATTAHHMASGEAGFEQVQITIDGEPWDLNHGDPDKRSHIAAAALAVGAAVGVLTLVALLMMPLALLAIGVVAGVAVVLALMALAAVLGVTFSPLWLLLLLAWLVFRRRSA